MSTDLKMTLGQNIVWDTVSKEVQQKILDFQEY